MPLRKLPVRRTSMHWTTGSVADHRPGQARLAGGAGRASRRWVDVSERILTDARPAQPRVRRVGPHGRDAGGARAAAGEHGEHRRRRRPWPRLRSARGRRRVRRSPSRETRQQAAQHQEQHDRRTRSGGVSRPDGPGRGAADEESSSERPAGACPPGAGIASRRAGVQLVRWHESTEGWRSARGRAAETAREWVAAQRPRQRPRARTAGSPRRRPR